MLIKSIGLFTKKEQQTNSLSLSLSALKINNISEAVRSAPSGFILLNGYHVKYDTYQEVSFPTSHFKFEFRFLIYIFDFSDSVMWQIIVGVATYFLLIINQWSIHQYYIYI